jgi:hypothetical protein
MTDLTSVIDRYFAIWNETDAARRRALIAQTWTDDARYVDPLLSGAGPDGIDAMVQSVQQQFPEHQFRRAGEIDTHNDRVRFAWVLVPDAGAAPLVAGVDFGVVAPDGRLQTVTGFLDQVPALQEV